ncbi:hypothetical protein RB195_006314 [Necator americanus]|uniref:G-protein coupled receptors family 1 profile domain-containing protein n=1 Tax=Necator americanus TaxID=51031 RepID=A0ABR1BS32_NECAM
MNCIANAAEVVRYPPWLSAMCLQSGLSAATVVVSIFFALRLKEKTMFSFSTIFLLTLATFFANLHAIVLLGIQLHHFVLSAIYTSACDLSLTTHACYVPNYLILCCILGMVVCQNALWMDRLAATFLPKVYSKHSKQFVIVLGILVIFISFLVPFLLLRKDPYDDRVLTCVITPRGSAANVNGLFTSLICLNFIAVFVNICLFVINKQREKMLRFNVSDRYQAYENITATKWIGLIAYAKLEDMVLSGTVINVYTAAHLAFCFSTHLPEAAFINSPINS